MSNNSELIKRSNSMIGKEVILKNCQHSWNNGKKVTIVGFRKDFLRGGKYDINFDAEDKDGNGFIIGFNNFDSE